jgi:peptidoglycan/LPS O-acetylase OafA/YrhL
MLQDVSALKKGVWVDTYAGNTPLWSLSYEWWFYMMFFPIVSVLFYSPKRQIGLVFVLSVLGFLSYQAIPNQLSLFLGYFFIWWVGVELSREYSSTGAITWSRQRMPVMMLVCLCALWSMPVAIAGSSAGKLLFGVGPVLQMRHFAAALIFTVVGIAWYHAEFVGFRLLLNPFAVLAPISYALYAFHVPVLQILESAGIKSPLPRLTIALIILLPICYLVEVVLQRRINRCFDRIIARSVLRSE